MNGKVLTLESRLRAAAPECWNERELAEDMALATPPPPPQRRLPPRIEARVRAASRRRCENLDADTNGALYITLLGAVYTFATYVVATSAGLTQGFWCAMLGVVCVVGMGAKALIDMRKGE